MTGRHDASSTVRVQVTELQCIRATMADMIRRNASLCGDNATLRAENEELRRLLADCRDGKGIRWA